MSSEALSPVELAVHRVLCEDAPGECAEWRGLCVRAVEAARPAIAAEVLRAFADAHRFPAEWVMFRRADGSGVTVPDLLRETAARLERAENEATIIPVIEGSTVDAPPLVLYRKRQPHYSPAGPDVCTGEDHPYCCTEGRTVLPDGSAVPAGHPVSYTPAQVVELMARAHQAGVQDGRQAAAHALLAWGQRQPLSGPIWAAHHQRLADIAQGGEPQNAGRDLGQPADIRDLPYDVVRLVHAVDDMRDRWAESDQEVRRELWRAVHDACDVVRDGRNQQDGGDRD